MSRGYFVTGTDTGVGKTLVSQALIYKLRKTYASVAGFKPVASGCRMTPEGLRNEDALALQQASSVVLSYTTVNPYAFAPPVAPHVGGWLVPLNEQQTVADLAQMLGLPVVLVVGLRLGCINHALLTAAAIRARGLDIMGWVANQIDPAFSFCEENIAAIDARMGAPLLMRIPQYVTSPRAEDLSACFPDRNDV
ncbi:MAG: dethiobiotin synthase [Gammaproteobacteria bacterium]|nr:dethiobiotin synthase [Gammaproteobacteria bacterium]